jgi:hypothetical protein
MVGGFKGVRLRPVIRPKTFGSFILVRTFATADTPDSPYQHWVKIKNPAYSQKEGRGDLFKRAGKCLGLNLEN